MKRASAVILVSSFAIVCMVVHFYSGWKSELGEAAMHGESAVFRDYLILWTRDTFENLQSEFWQLAVQFALLAGFFEFIHVKSYEKDVEENKRRLDQVLVEIDHLKGTNNA